MLRACKVPELIVLSPRALGEPCDLRSPPFARDQLPTAWTCPPHLAPPQRLPKVGDSSGETNVPRWHGQTIVSAHRAAFSENPGSRYRRSRVQVRLWAARPRCG